MPPGWPRYRLLSEKREWNRDTKSPLVPKGTGGVFIWKQERNMDISLHYHQKGKGFPLVLLHGNGEDGGYFVRQTDYFSARWRVLAVDTRGHGQSPRGDAPFTLEQFAGDLKDLLDSLGIARAVLLGFSDGANIALLFTLRYPEYVERLILNGGNLNPGGVKPSVQLPICLGYAIVSLCAKFDKKAVPKKELLGLMVKQPHIDPQALSAIRCPTLVIAGDRDLIQEKHTKLIHASIPGAALAILPGDHFVARRNSAAFNRAVEDFLQEGNHP